MPETRTKTAAPMTTYVPVPTLVVATQYWIAVNPISAESLSAALL